jgi:hypothetical protein
MLLQSQEEDLKKICQKVTKIETLPVDLNQLKKVVDFYDVVIGVVPLPLQVQILQMKKPVLLFDMISLGTAKSKQEAEELLAKSGKEGVILPPSKEGELYRVSIYRGIIMVKEIKIEQDYIIKHG